MVVVVVEVVVVVVAVGFVIFPLLLTSFIYFSEQSKCHHTKLRSSSTINM